jgi:hypothetical protein
VLAGQALARKAVSPLPTVPTYTIDSPRELSVKMLGHAMQFEPDTFPPIRKGQPLPTDDEKPAAREPAAEVPTALIAALVAPVDQHMKNYSIQLEHIDSRFTDLAGIASFQSILLGVVGIILLAQLVTCGRQLRELRRTVRAFQSSDQPNVCIGSAQLALFEIDNAAVGNAARHIPTVHWTIDNLGKSPATIHEVRSEIYFGLASQNFRTFEYSEARLGTTILPAGCKSPLMTTQHSRAITEAEIDETLVNSKEIIFFGYVKYKDTFNIMHTYNFGLKLIPPSLPTLSDFSTQSQTYNFREKREAQFA